MAPLPNNLTIRYFLDYEGDMGKHTMLFRFAPSGTTQPEQITKITSIVNLMKVICYPAVVFSSLRKSDVLSNVSFPVPWTPIAGTGTGTQAAIDIPRFITWVGRDTQGIRVKYTLFGSTKGVDNDYRIPIASDAQVQAIWNGLNTGATPLVTAGNDAPIMNPYANVGWNAYFQRKRRKVA